MKQIEYEEVNYEELKGDEQIFRMWEPFSFEIIPKKKEQKEQFFNEINKALLDGKTVHMYPEGALWPYYEKIRTFKKGAFKMAVNANCPIVPILYEFKEPDGIFAIYKKKKCIHAKILNPVYPNHELEKTERIRDLENRVLKEYCN